MTDRAASLTSPPSPIAQLMHLATGYADAAAVYAAAKLGIADALTQGPLAVLEIAERVGAQPQPLLRLMRCLAATGVFEHVDEDRFALTPMSELLRSDRDDSMRDGIIFFGDQMLWRSYGALLHTLKTGETAFDQVFGAQIFDYMAHDREMGAVFDKGMTALSRPVNEAIVAAYDFSIFQRVIDVGGGHGSLLAAILRQYPRLTGAVFDLPHVSAGARKNFAALNLTERADALSGSMFEHVPPGADAYLMKWILHDWDDASCVRILNNCRAAMAPQVKLLVIDRVLPARITRSPQMRALVMHDLTMMVHQPGRERTEGEFRALFDVSGFKLTRIVATRVVQSVIEAEPC